MITRQILSSRKYSNGAQSRHTINRVGTQRYFDFFACFSDKYISFNFTETIPKYSTLYSILSTDSPQRTPSGKYDRETRDSTVCGERRIRREGGSNSSRISLMVQNKPKRWTNQNQKSLLPSSPRRFRLDPSTVSTCLHPPARDLQSRSAVALDAGLAFAVALFPVGTSAHTGPGERYSLFGWPSPVRKVTSNIHTLASRGGSVETEPSPAERP